MAKSIEACHVALGTRIRMIRETLGLSQGELVEARRLVERGTITENGQPWAEVVFGKKIEAVLAKADAILALLHQRSQGEIRCQYSTIAIPTATIIE